MDFENPVVQAWLWLMTIAFIIAFIASMPPRRPISTWLGDFFVRWGLAGILVWFVVNGIWAVRELMGMKLMLYFSPLEAYLEYATVWGAVFTGLATFIFFGSALLLNAIFSAPAAADVQIIYYRRIAAYAVYHDAKSVEKAREAAARKRAREAPVKTH